MKKRPFDRLRANGRCLEVIVVSSVHAEPFDVAQESLVEGP